MMDDRGPQPTPLWMDVPAPRSNQRTGVTSKNTFWQTVGFFGAITIAVGAAGAVGIALWGPDKTVKNRSQLATNPPPPVTMPSLPDSASATAAAEPPPAAAAPTDSAAPGPASNKGKKSPHVGKRKH